MANTKITSRVLADNAVLTANITDANVTTAKVADNAVTGDKVADDVALAGNPTTTTQSAGNNTTRIATTAFVSTAVANLADSAPDALNTLNELAAALGDDANFSTTVTNSIATKLPLAGGTMTGQLLINASVSGNYAVKIDNTHGSSGNGLRIETPSADSNEYALVVKSNNGSNNILIAANDGNVGIGTDSAGQKLEVYNSATDSQSYVKIQNNRARNAAVNFVTTAANWYVGAGIGTDTDVFQIYDGDVGTRFLITDAGTFGMGSGSGSLAGSIIINNDGGTGTINNAYYNTVLGWEAADDLTSGDSNTIVGTQAGYKLTEATGCTLIGRLAGETLTTGSYNTAIGFNTMGDGVVTGSSNTAVGNSVMVAVTSGAGNTALGEACAAALTTGSNNVAIGRSAMSNAAVTGNFNIAVGYEALRAVTSGGENICMGRDAGHDLTSANQNVAIGHESMTKNQTGTGNVCVGFQAGENCTAGGNVFIGYKAGEAQEGGVYNIMIGDATAGTHPSHSQAIVIGRNISAAPGEVAFGTSSLGRIASPFNSSVSWSGGSDERLKQNITDSALGLDFINDLRPVTFKWKPNNELPETFSSYQKENDKDTETIQTGLIAQEVKTAIDASGAGNFNAWSEDHEGIQQIAPAGFVYPLIKAVQELTTKLEAAEARIRTLEES